MVAGCEDAFGAFVFSTDPAQKAAPFIAKNIHDVSGKARIAAQNPVLLLDKENAKPQRGQSSGGGVSMGEGFDFSFPVDLGTPDAAALKIEWNQGDDPVDAR